MNKLNDGAAKIVDELKLEAPPHAAFISMARLFAGAVARHYWCDEDTVDDIKIAISESVTNAIKAHQDDENDSPIRVIARVENERLVFEISDDGAGIDPSHIDRLDTTTPPTGLFEGSLGLTVIRSLFEDAQIIATDPRGTTVRFSVELGAMDGTVPRD